MNSDEDSSSELEIVTPRKKTKRGLARAPIGHVRFEDQTTSSEVKDTTCSTDDDLNQESTDSLSTCTAETNEEDRGFKNPCASCLVCGDSFYSIPLLVGHIESEDHLDVQFHCHECGPSKRYKTYQSVLKHRQNYHADSDVRRDNEEYLDASFVCDICTSIFYEEEEMTNHMIDKHGRDPDENVTFNCGLCSKTFTKRSHLAYHVTLHCNREKMPFVEVHSASTGGKT